MAEYPPFMNAYGLLTKILTKIKEAKTPERFTQDFLTKTLGFTGGSARAFIPLAKRIGILGSDGSPTDIYKGFRNPDQSKASMAQSIKIGYSELYNRNENAHQLDKKRLEGLLTEITGLEQGHQTIKAISGTFEALKSFADFEKKMPKEKKLPPEAGTAGPSPEKKEEEELSLNLSYTINLVLPKTDDIAVFNAIFKSLKENLLRK